MWHEFLDETGNARCRKQHVETAVARKGMVCLCSCHGARSWSDDESDEFGKSGSSCYVRAMAEKSTDGVELMVVREHLLLLRTEHQQQCWRIP